MTVGFLLKGESTMLIAIFIAVFVVVSLTLLVLLPATVTPARETNVAYAHRLIQERIKAREDHEAWVRNVNFPWQG